MDHRTSGLLFGFLLVLGVVRVCLGSLFIVIVIQYMPSMADIRYIAISVILPFSCVPLHKYV